MTGIAMSPSENIDELAVLRERVSFMEADIARYKQRIVACEARFKLLADAAPLMIWMSGVDGMCTYFNRAWLEFRGRRLEDEAGNRWVDGVHPDDRNLCLETYLKCFTTRQPFRMQYRLLTHAGTFRWVECAGSPWYEGAGEFGGFVGAAIDIDDRKQGIFTPDEHSVRLIYSLTERERQVLVLIANGKSTKAAAQELGRSSASTRPPVWSATRSAPA
jgi:PAS domain S-box-containing protein